VRLPTRSESEDSRSAAIFPGQPLLTVDDVAALLQVSRRTVFRLRARGLLPVPVEISTNIIRWRAEDLRAYVAGLRKRNRRQQRQTEPPA
jgi:predicted DNA-binding transcriptional regulator AlpA